MAIKNPGMGAMCRLGHALHSSGPWHLPQVPGPFPAFSWGNKIRVKYVLGVFDPVESEYVISFTRFLIGYAAIEPGFYNIVGFIPGLPLHYWEHMQVF